MLFLCNACAQFRCSVGLVYFAFDGITCPVRNVFMKSE
jgi:hypothetical protein